MPLPTDTLLSQQWHLIQTVPGLLDLNVRGVWNPSQGAAYSGAGTRTVVIDDGFDYTHADLAPGYDQTLDFDFQFATLDAFGFDAEGHGTDVAGIIGAAANGSGAVGVAFGTSLVGYRTIGEISDEWLSELAFAIRSAAVDAQADQANISQGIANDAFSVFRNGYDPQLFGEIETSIGTAVEQGRGGLGMTIVKSAGNSREDTYDVNADDWTNDTRQVVVAAVDQNGFVSDYSSYGAAVLVSGFGTPGEVVTTDRVGNAGFVAGDFDFGFNGTSSAAPMVTGVVALMYEAAPGLGWRDVQSILALSARHVGSAVGSDPAGFEFFAWTWNDARTWNGGGQHFSNDYGYGLVDALAAVRLAETWALTGTAAATSANQAVLSVDLLNTATIIPDNDLTGLSFGGSIDTALTVERVTVEIAFSTTFIGDIEVYLISPGGTVCELIADCGGGNVDIGGIAFDGRWTFEAQAFRGEQAQGTWTVRVVDDGPGDEVTVSDLVIRTFGAASTDDRHILTDEFSDYDGVAGHVTAISDTNGGTDTVNAAAVTTASVIRLNGQSGSVDGVAVTFAGFEHAIGGDAGDTLAGDGQGNRLSGMRGNDRLEGLDGNDTLDGGNGIDRLFGGAGIDRLNGGAGADTMEGGLGNDTYFVDALGDVVQGEAAFGSGGGIDTVFASASFTAPVNVELVRAQAGAGNLTLTGNDAPGTLVGNEGNNTLNGRGGNDQINGNAGRDTLTGGEGADTLVGGTGADTFVFSSVSNSRAGVAARDVINGFTRSPGDQDVIDLSAIDANTLTAGVNNAFTFIGSAAFALGGASAGQLRLVGLGGPNAVIVEGDVNGDRVADFQVFVNGQTTMGTGDFLL